MTLPDHPSPPRDAWWVWLYRVTFFDRQSKLRNGWWLLIFATCVFVTTLSYRPISHGLQGLGVTRDWLHPAPVAMVLLATWVCTRLRREPLASVGLRLDGRWMREFALGCGLGFGALALAAALIYAIGGVRFELEPTRSMGALVFGLYMFLFAGKLEELLFRGYAFQRLVSGLGVWPAQVVLALLFALAHWQNPGMEGAVKVWASIDIALAAITLGVAYLRTRSLALPIGIHLAWNWTQGCLFGFGVSGMEVSGWLHPRFQGLPTWVTGGEFGPEASVFGVLADLVMLAVVWKWVAPVNAPTAPVPAPADTAALSTSST
jgi:membrane protease YdiL (CAAX protease family)